MRPQGSARWHLAIVVLLSLVLGSLPAFGLPTAHAPSQPVVPAAASARSVSLGFAAAPALTSSSGAYPSTGSVFWENLTRVSPTAPSNRQMVFEAFYPPLNETILFGGYDGFESDVAYGDTWAFHNNNWTELSESGGPSPRFGGGMVYDSREQALILFGGSTLFQKLNDTWEFNTTGWHALPLGHAPSPRDGFGFVYDASIGAAVLFGGRTDIPGTFGANTFYRDTWIYQAGTWSNVTAMAGPAPPGGYFLGQMTYDGADGYVLMTGGVDLNQPGCQLPYGAVWSFSGGHWSEASASASSPPAGRGALWFDTDANRTFYYEAQENVTGGCETYHDEVWSYAAGAWTLVTSGGPVAPLPRVNVQVVDDQGDHEQILFGGGGPAYAQYLGDTWECFPAGTAPSEYRVTFRETGLPAGRPWTIELGPVSGDRSQIQTVVANIFSVPLLEAAGIYYFFIHSSGHHQLVGSPSIGVLRVDGVGIVPAFQFGPGPTYSISAHERGLRTGTTWCLAVGGLPFCSATPRVVARALSPGTYNYSIEAIPSMTTSVTLAHAAVNPSGSLYLNTSDVLQVRYGYSVVFSESGLPTGTHWGVTIAGQIEMTTGSNVTVALTNGTYTFRTLALTHYVAGLQSGRITVAGSPFDINIPFFPGG